MPGSCGPALRAAAAQISNIVNSHPAGRNILKLSAFRSGGGPSETGVPWRCGRGPAPRRAAFQTVSRFRPFLRRAFSTCCPALVFIRARNPCFFFFRRLWCRNVGCIFPLPHSAGSSLFSGFEFFNIAQPVFYFKCTYNLRRRSDCVPDVQLDPAQVFAERFLRPPVRLDPLRRVAD